MSKIGLENVPQDIDDKYHKKEKEFLVLCIHTPETSSQLGSNDYWTKSVKILGYIETASGRTSNIKSYMEYAVKENNEPEFFKKDGIYRVKGRLPKLIDSAETWVNNEYRMSGLYVTEIISDNEENDFLENLLTEYNKEVSINSGIFGKLIFNKELDWYETKNNLEWCGEDDVEFSISPDGENDINEFLPLAEEFYKNRQEWDRKLREFSASKLTENANDWAYQEYDEEESASFKEITEKEFVERISIDGITLYTDGSFNAFYNDDDMFWGHSIVINGNIKTSELESADLFG